MTNEWGGRAKAWSTGTTFWSNLSVGGYNEVTDVGREGGIGSVPLSIHNLGLETDFGMRMRGFSNSIGRIVDFMWENSRAGQPTSVWATDARANTHSVWLTRTPLWAFRKNKGQQKSPTNNMETHIMDPKITHVDDTSPLWARPVWHRAEPQRALQNLKVQWKVTIGGRLYPSPL